MHTFHDVRRLVIVSDTHGLIRTNIEPELTGADLILHADDVGSAAVLAFLNRFAPAIAVRGNVDGAELGLPDAEVISINGELVYLLHQLEHLDLNPRVAGLRMVISGHSHKASMSLREGVWYCNPGSIGPRRFRLPITLVRFTLGASTWTGALREISPLPDGRAEACACRTRERYVVNFGK